MLNFKGDPNQEELKMTISIFAAEILNLQQQQHSKKAEILARHVFHQINTKDTAQHVTESISEASHKKEILQKSNRFLPLQKKPFW